MGDDLKGLEPLLLLRCSAGEISTRSRLIHTSMTTLPGGVDGGDFAGIGGDSLEMLLRLYDEQFFSHKLTAALGDRLTLRFSRRLTSSSGQTRYNRKTGALTISISLPLLFQTFHDVEREVIVSGIPCGDRLEALMRTFEHELIHVLEFAAFGRSSCRQARFRRMSANIFGHRGVTHGMVTNRERVAKVLGLRAGDRVTFLFQGVRLDGIINRITKRATVLVADPQGAFADRRGVRYKKYYVPVQLLQRQGTR